MHWQQKNILFPRFKSTLSKITGIDLSNFISGPEIGAKTPVLYVAPQELHGELVSVEGI